MFGGTQRWLFTLTIFVGSFILFLVQPMVARMALPLLGGSPNVWNSAMLVYQALLLGGYAYAHWLGRFALRRQALVHLGLLALAALTLPLALPKLASPAPGWEFVWVPWLFVLTVGPVFFAVSAQAPLLQRWFAADPSAGEPYALYAASNLGSFAGLLAYPLLAEPLMGLRSQGLLWAAGYGLLVALVAAVVASRWYTVPVEARTEAREAWSLERTTVILWLLLAAVPSGLMLSTTTSLTTDIMAMPLLWVIPLGLYLLSFTVAFAETRIWARIIAGVAPLVIPACALVFFGIGAKAPLLSATANLLLLFVASVALHTRMYESRPDPRHLTGFYLVMSAGGVIGGAFTALLAPLVFTWTWEHPLLILAAIALLPLAHLRDRLGRLSIRPQTLRLAMVLLTTVAVGSVSLFDQAFSRADINRKRSYFGIYKIERIADGGRVLVHGTTAHGSQGGASTAPTAYYGATGGAGMVLSRLDELVGDKASVGVVGLGAGTLACYRRPQDKWQFFEIDPAVYDYSRDGTFTFLSECTPEAPVIIGDARIKLAEGPAHAFDVLIVDAFSSDAIPMHLVTTDAVRTYRRVLKPGGILVVHITNRYFDLEPVFAGIAREDGWHAALSADDPKGNGLLAASTWVAMTQDDERMARITQSGVWRDLRAGEGSVWTDEYASTLPYIKWDEL